MLHLCAEKGIVRVTCSAPEHNIMIWQDFKPIQELRVPIKKWQISPTTISKQLNNILISCSWTMHVTCWRLVKLLSSLLIHLSKKHNFLERSWWEFIAESWKFHLNNKFTILINLETALTHRNKLCYIVSSINWKQMMVWTTFKLCFSSVGGSLTFTL